MIHHLQFSHERHVGGLATVQGASVHTSQHGVGVQQTVSHRPQGAGQLAENVVGCVDVKQLDTNKECQGLNRAGQLAENVVGCVDVKQLDTNKECQGLNRAGQLAENVVGCVDVKQLDMNKECQDLNKE